MAKMMWGGRFSEGPDRLLLDYMSAENVLLDSRLIPYDIAGNRAHVHMLGEQGILKREEAKAVLQALRQLESDWQQGRFSLKKELEDVHMNIEAAATKITDHAKKMHTARSRNDQVNLDMRLYMRSESLEAAERLNSLRRAFAALASRNKETPMIGYTHTRVAQPMSAALWCGAYFDAFGRDAERLVKFAKSSNTNPLGAGAVAGTKWKIDRHMTAGLLAFDSVQENEFDVISSRGEFELELINALALFMLRASRLSEELIFLSEKGLVNLPDRLCTGSSIMPQKKNPDALELVRGRAARVLGCYVHCASLLKGLMSGHNADTQETKYAVFMAVDTAKEAAVMLTEIAQSISFNSDAIRLELERGYACATSLADLLAEKGVPFREAHEITGALVKECAKRGVPLSDLKADEIGKIAKVKLGEAELRKVLSPSGGAAKGAKIDLASVQRSEEETGAFKGKIKAAFDRLRRL